MAASEVRAGRAYVEAYLRDKLSPELDKIQKKMKATGDAIAGLGTKMIGVGGAVVAAFVPAIKAASDLNESMSKFDVVFGDSAKGMREWSSQTAKEVGRSQKVIADFVSRAQNVFVPLGIDPKAAEDMSKTLTKLAIDLGSFNNVEDEVGFQKVISGMLGESEPLKAFGVIVNETATKAELLNMKLDPEKATDSQKAFARLNIIMRSTTAAQGDAVRTADGFANSLKRFQGEAFDAAAALGTQLLPFVNQYLHKVIDGIVAVSKWVEANREAVKEWGEFALKAGAVTVAVGGVLVVLGKAISVASVVPAVIKGVSAALMFLAANPIGAVVAGLGLLVAGFIAWRHSMGPTMRDINDITSAALASSKALEDQASAMKPSIDKLHELALKTSLSADEQKAAAGIISKLTAQYGDLGLSINSATGAIEGYDAASSKMNEAERTKQVEALEGALAELNGRLAVNNVRVREYQAKLGEENIFAALVNGTAGTLQEYDHRSKELMDKIRETQDQIAKLKGGSNPFGEDQQGDGSTAMSKNVEAARQAQLQVAYSETAEKLNKLREAQKLELASETDKKLNGVNEKLKEQIDLLDELQKNAEQRNDKDALAKLEKDRTDILANAEEQRRRIREEAHKKEQDEQQKHAEELQKAAEKEAEAAKEAQEKARDARHFELEQLKQLAEAQGNEAKAKELDKKLKQDDFEKQLDQVFGSGPAAAAMKVRARAIQSAIEAAQDKRVERADSSAGLFNAAALQSLQGNRFQDRQLAAAEKAERYLYDIRKKALDGDGLTFN